MWNFFKSFGIKFSLIFIVASILSYYSYCQLEYPNVGFDDANIFMVYAKNLSNGNGFVYNINGERVEGFTSLLYVLILSVFFRITENPERLILLFNLFITSLAITCISEYIDKIEWSKGSYPKHPRPNFSLGSLIFLTWTFSSPGYITWASFSLMDTGLWSTLLLFFTILVSYSFLTTNKLVHLSLYSIIFLLVLTRPESIFLVPFILIAAGVTAAYVSIKKFKEILRILYIPLAVFLGTLFFLTLFRVIYFGYPLPNTYYAKVSPNLYYNLKDGLQYLYAFTKANIIIPFALSSACLIVFFPLKKSNNKLKEYDFWWLIISVAILVSFIIPVLSGGDHFRWFRFFQPVWPLIIIPLYIIIINLFSKNQYDINQLNFSNIRYLAIIPSFILFSLLANPTWYDFSISNPAHEGSIARNGRKIGYMLNGLFYQGEKPSVGVVTSGGIKFSYKGVVVDLMGVNNVTMGHSPGNREGTKNHAAFNKEIFYQLAPSLLLPRIFNELPTSDEYHNIWDIKALKGLLDDPGFKTAYSLVGIKKKEKDLFYIVAYTRKEFLKELENNQSLGLEVISLNRNLGQIRPIPFI